MTIPNDLSTPPGMEVLDPQSMTPTLVFPSLDVALAAVHLRILAWRMLRRPAQRDAGIGIFRAAPSLALGTLSEWAALKTTCEGLVMGANQPTWPATAAPHLLATMANVNATAALGPRIEGDEAPDPCPLTSIGSAWHWQPTGHALLEALIFGDVGEVQALLDAGLDPNVQRPRPIDDPEASDGPLIHVSAWSYCLSLLFMTQGDLEEAGLAGPLEDVRAVAGDLLERFLLHGLDPATPVDARNPQGTTRQDQLHTWSRGQPDSPCGWGRRWAKAIEEYQLRRSLHDEPPSQASFQRPRL